MPNFLLKEDGDNLLKEDGDDLLLEVPVGFKSPLTLGVLRLMGVEAANLSNLKTFNAVTKANIKIINGVSLSQVKSVNGLT